MYAVKCYFNIWHYNALMNKAIFYSACVSKYVPKPAIHCCQKEPACYTPSVHPKSIQYCVVDIPHPFCARARFAEHDLQLFLPPAWNYLEQYINNDMAERLVKCNKAHG